MILIIIFLNFLFLILLYLFIQKTKSQSLDEFVNENKRVLSFFICFPLFFDLFLLIYRFRYREYTVETEFFLWFYVIMSSLFLTSLFIFMYLLQKKYKDYVVSNFSKIKKITIILVSIFLDSNPRLNFIHLKFYRYIEYKYRKLLFKPELMAIIFILIPWLIFLIVFIVEILKGQGFWLTLYFLAFRILILRFRTVIYYICRTVVFNHLTWNLKKFINLKSKDKTPSRIVEICQNPVLLEKSLLKNLNTISNKTILFRWTGFATLLYYSKLYIFSDQISNFYYNKMKIFIHILNLITFILSLMFFYTVQFNLYYLLFDLIINYLCVLILIIHNFIFYQNKPNTLFLHLLNKQKYIFDFVERYNSYLFNVYKIEKKDLVIHLDETMWLIKNSWMQKFPRLIPFKYSRIVIKIQNIIKIIFRKIRFFIRFFLRYFHS